MPSADDPLPGDATAALVDELVGDGVDRAVVLIRHSARTYDRSIPEIENLLTDDGRELAYRLGTMLPDALALRGYTSPVARCVDTLEHVARAHTDAGGRVVGRLREIKGLGALTFLLDEDLFGRYIRDNGGDVAGFYSEWMAERVDPAMMVPSTICAELTVQLMAEKLERPLPEPTLVLLAAHDWNLLPVKEHWLHQRFDDVGPVQYLEGVALYERGGKLRMKGITDDEVAIDLSRPVRS